MKKRGRVAGAVAGLSWILVLAAPVAGCTRGPGVTRVMDGKTVTGPPIPGTAYAQYLSGVMLETQQEWEAAAGAYRRALRDDDESPEIWTRLGKVLCQDGKAQDARHALREAVSLDGDYAPGWLETARCDLKNGNAASAIQAAQRAVGLQPRSVDATRTLVSAYQQAGDPDAGLRWAEGLVAYATKDVAGWELLLDAAARAESTAQVRRAQKHLRAIRKHLNETDGSVSLADLDRALASQDLTQARAFATQMRQPPAYVALRAVALGKPALGHEQATLVWRADPDNTDAFIALLAAERALAEPASSARKAPRRPPSPLAARLMASVLSARLGRPAADAWLAGLPDLPPPADGVEADLYGPSDTATDTEPAAPSANR